MNHRPLTSAIAALSATFLLAACSGGGHSVGGSGTTLTAATTALAKPTNSAQAPAGMTMASVPDLDTSTVNVFTSKPTSDTLPVTAADGKQYKPAGDKELIAVGWALPGDTSVAGGYGMNTTHTISVIADGKTLASQTVDRNAYSDGGGWIMSIPKTDKPVTVRVSADDGQQNIPAGSSKRDDATSNGLPVGATMNAPVAAQLQCDIASPTQDGQAGCANITWTLTDHDARYGWAKPGHGILMALIPTVEVPMHTGGTMFDPTPRLQAQAAADPVLSNKKLDGHDALVDTHDDATSQASLNAAFPVTATDTPTKLSADVHWTGYSGFSDTTDGHASLSVTGTQAHQLTLATK